MRQSAISDETVTSYHQRNFLALGCPCLSEVRYLHLRICSPLKLKSYVPCSLAPQTAAFCLCSTFWRLARLVKYQPKQSPKADGEVGGGRGLFKLCISNLGHRWEWVIKAKPRTLYPRERNLVPTVEEAGWALGPVWSGTENLAPTGVRNPDRPACSESLHRIQDVTLNTSTGKGPAKISRQSNYNFQIYL